MAMSDLERRTRAVGLPAYLTHPRPKDGPEFVSAVARSQSLHLPWVDPPDDAEEYGDFVRRSRRKDCSYYLVRESATGALAGVINLSQIFYGNFESCYAGYYGFTGMTGRGLMTAGLKLVVHEAFATLRLHRMEANIQPMNLRSIELARRVGFVKEGYSKKYLRILGEWRDHERWAMVREGE